MSDALVLAIKLVPLLLICSFAPGLWIVSRLRWSPLEKLCGAMAASFVLTYLVSFTLFCANAGAWAYWGTSIIFAIIGVLNWRQAAIMLRRHRSRSAILAFGFVLAWDFLHLAMVRNMGGGSWAGDWYEHYDRTRYFVHQLPNTFYYAYLYLLPARPPMMNVIAAYFCRQVGMEFAAFSLVFSFLNAFSFLPCCLLLRQLIRRGSRQIPALAALFMLNPSVLQNMAFTWTKAFAGGLVVLGVCFYLRGIRDKGPVRIVAAALCLAAATLVHYSGMPFVVAIVIHYATLLIGRRRTLLEATKAISTAIALLATWFLWSARVFGWHDTLFSNTTVAWKSVMSASNADALAHVVYNYFTSIVPHPFHGIPPGWLDKVDNWGLVREYYFLMSQTTLTMMIGCTAGVVAALLLLKIFLFGIRQSRIDRRFWIIFLLVGYFLGIGTVPGVSPFGTAHVTLQPLAVMGVTLLASRLLRLPPALFWVVILGAVIDYSLGIYLNFDMHAHAFESTGSKQTSLNLLTNDQFGFGFDEFGKKTLEGYTFWGDWFAGILPGLKAMSVVGAVVIFYRLIAWRLAAIRQR